MATPVAINQLSLAPLGAGDLIDRAVRLYRRHFTTLIRIAALPVLLSTVGSLLVTIGSRSTDPTALGGDLLLVIFGMALSVGGLLLNAIVMGGAARNLITHLLWNEPFSARATFRNVRARFWRLLGAAVLIAIWVFVAFFIALIAWAFGLRIFVFQFLMSAGEPSLVLSLAVIIMALGLTFLAFTLFFLMVKFIAYVPQVLMIEGRGVFDSVGRSVNLARGNLWRLMVMFLFYWFASISAMMLLLIPLFIYGNAQGVNINPNMADSWPTWFAIGYNVLGQMITILLVPVLMLGLSLMYVDERVRQEGYDIELIAARQLGEMPPNFYGGQAAAPRSQAAAATTQSPGSLQFGQPGRQPGLR